MKHANRLAAWTVDDLQSDAGWIFELDDRARGELTGTVRKAADPGRRCSTTGGTTSTSGLPGR